ncbi:MAG: hypothetical protein U0893_10525 [Chloroflexota bacterium]
MPGESGHVERLSDGRAVRGFIGVKDRRLPKRNTGPDVAGDAPHDGACLLGWVWGADHVDLCRRGDVSRLRAGYDPKVFGQARCGFSHQSFGGNIAEMRHRH